MIFESDPITRPVSDRVGSLVELAKLDTVTGSRSPSAGQSCWNSWIVCDFLNDVFPLRLATSAGVREEVSP